MGAIYTMARQKLKKITHMNWRGGQFRPFIRNISAVVFGQIVRNINLQRQLEYIITGLIFFGNNQWCKLSLPVLLSSFFTIAQKRKHVKENILINFNFKWVYLCFLCTKQSKKKTWSIRVCELKLLNSYLELWRDTLWRNYMVLRLLLKLSLTNRQPVYSVSVEFSSF